MSINPYQPPTQVDDAADFDGPTALKDIGTIRFSGTPHWQDLNRLFAKHDHVGAPTMILLAMLCILFSLFGLVVGSVGWLLISLGCSVVVFAACLVSTKFYRRLMFSFTNPRWSKPTTCELDSEGVWITRSDSTRFLHWNCFERVVLNRDVVGFFTPQSIGESLVVNQSMCASESDFTKLHRAAELLSRHVVTAETTQQRRWTVEALMKEPNRQRMVPIPDGAIAFSGPVSMDDLRKVDQQLPRKLTRRKRSTHGLMVITLLTISLMLILTGISNMVANSLGVALVFGLMATPLTVFFWLRRWSQPPMESADLLQFVYAFADADGITLDAFAVVTKLPWSHLKRVGDLPDRMIFRHTHSRRAVTARRDMFASEDDWNAIKTLASAS
ncbi:MAG: hypothetical protein WBD20_20740 [Pirellulaceae bacterium]